MPENPPPNDARLNRFWAIFGGAFALCLLVRYPAMQAGFALDDFAQMAMAKGIFVLHRAPWDLFSFVRSEAEVRAGIESGALPWWTDPDLRLAFFRPISSLLAYFDARVLGPNAFLQHLHSLAWLGGLVAGATALYRRVLGPRAVLIAIGLFAVEEALTTPLAWVANRNALVASAFALWALVAWVDARDADAANDAEKARSARIRTEVLTAAALLSGEYGVTVLFLRAALGLADRKATWKQGFAHAGALALVLALYAGLHRALGYGVASFPLYYDPREGGAQGYMKWAGEQCVRLLQDLVMGVPTTAPLGSQWEGFVRIGLYSLWALFLVVWAILAARPPKAAKGESEVPPDTTGAPARWAYAPAAMTVGGLLSFAPLASSIAHTRLLILPAVGFSALLGVAVDRTFVRMQSPQRKIWRVLVSGALVALMLVTHGPQAALRSVREPGRGPIMNAARVKAILQAPVQSNDRVLLLSAGDPTTILYFPQVRAVFGVPAPKDFRVLSANSIAQRLKRIDDRTLEIETPRSGLLSSPLASVMRTLKKTFAEGDTIAAGPLTTTIADVGPLGPTRIRYTFDRSLDDPEFRVLTSSPQGLVPFKLPAIGTSVGIPPGADPVELRE